jgi:hypothetical protein
MTQEADLTTALRALAARYARAVDRRDADLFVSVFHPDGTLEVFRPGEEAPASVLTGHDALRPVTENMKRYAVTFHFLGQSDYVFLSPDRASGEVYCVAHHLSPGAGPAGETTDRVMYIRYQDDYRLGDDGEWRIASRRLHSDWIDIHPIQQRR